MIVLSEHDVRELLDMQSCIEAMTEVLASLARGELYNPLRSIARPRGRGHAARAHAVVPRRRDAVVRAQGDRRSCPTNPSRGLDTHMGGVLLHDGDTGELLAIMNASPITEIRTAAVSGGRDARARAAGRAASRDPRRGRAGSRPRPRDARRPRRSGDPDLGAPARRRRGARGRGRSDGLPVHRRRALRRRGRVHDDRVRRADRREALARPRRARERGRLVLPDDARARHGDGRALLVLHRPPRVVPERGGRLHHRRVRRARSAPTTSRPSSARCSPGCTPVASTRTS